MRASTSTSASSAFEAPVAMLRENILLVAGRIGDDEFALGGRKEPVRDIDGDALLPLGHEAIDKK